MITLVLTIERRLIGAIPVDENRFRDREYIAGKVAALRQKFAAQLSASFKPAEIYLEGVPSKMNSTSACSATLDS